MVNRVDRAKRHKKIKELREKHKDPGTGAYKTDAGTPYDLEYIAWLQQQELAIDYAHMSRQDNRDYFESYKAFSDVTSKPSGQLALWEDQALIALSSDHQESIEMGEASKDQWNQNIRVISKQFIRQANAYAITASFQEEIFDEWTPADKKAREVADRIKRKSAGRYLKDAAD